MFSNLAYPDSIDILIGLLIFITIYFKNTAINVWLGNPFKLSDVNDNCNVMSELPNNIYWIIFWNCWKYESNSLLLYVGSMHNCTFLYGQFLDVLICINFSINKRIGYFFKYLLVQQQFDSFVHIHVFMGNIKESQIVLWEAMFMIYDIYMCLLYYFMTIPSISDNLHVFFIVN